MHLVPFRIQNISIQCYFVSHKFRKNRKQLCNQKCTKISRLIYAHVDALAISVLWVYPSVFNKTFKPQLMEHLPPEVEPDESLGKNLMGPVYFFWNWIWQYSFCFIEMNDMQNFKEMLIRQYIIGGFVHFFQDLSSKVDIRDIWGPGHGVKNLTDNNQLVLRSRGPHQMKIFLLYLYIKFW